MKTNYFIIFILVILSISIQSCKKDENKPQVDTPENKIHASGFIQKGPFISGSQITIQELDNSLTPNGTTYQTVTNDDFGSFVLNSAITSDYLEVISTGFYFNEVSGSLSQANLSLRAICHISDSSVANVNILTTLSKKRVEYLMKNENKSYINATQQAENEILSIFNIDSTNIEPFNQMDISQNGESNAILLAISVMLQSNNSVAELSELISKISLDIETDGILDNTNIIEFISNVGKELNLSSIRHNIENRYLSLGLSTTIPNFEAYIDTADIPISDFETNETFVLPNQPVSFTDISSNYPTSWVWDFGDGQTSTQQNPTHTYSANGTYNVSLIATNDQGSDTIIKSNYITVTNNVITYDNVNYFIHSSYISFGQNNSEGYYASSLSFRTDEIIESENSLDFGRLLHSGFEDIVGTYNIAEIQEPNYVMEIFFAQLSVAINQGTLTISSDLGFYIFELDGFDINDTPISMYCKVEQN